MSVNDGAYVIVLWVTHSPAPRSQAACGASGTRSGWTTTIAAAPAEGKWRLVVDATAGLGTALSSYVRTMGARSGMTVHLTLDEAPQRLRSDVESELLRIAQEAVTNARKHAGASNLWVTCEVDPPYAQIEVSDDGQGMADQRPDGRYGLAIMAERAERIRGRLEIRPRQPSGTTVAVVLGTSARRDNVRGSAAPEGE